MPDHASYSPSQAGLALLELRARAEVRQLMVGQRGPERTSAETLWLVEELQVHQIELELQNEELLQAQVAAVAAQSEAEAARARYADLYHSAPVAYVTLDAQGVMGDLNARASQLLGLPVDQLTGRRLLLFVAPDSREVVAQYLQQCLADRARHTVEASLLTEPGTRLAVCLEGASTPPPAGPLTVRVALLDITARKQAEARLNERVRYLTEASPATAFSLTCDGRVEYISPQWYRYTGRQLGTTLGEPWPLDVHPADRGRVRRVLAEAMSQGHPWRYEGRLRNGAGMYRWFLCQGVPVADAANQPLRWYGTQVDVHEQWELQQALLQKNEQLANTAATLDTFVYTAAHDLQQPLNNLTGLFAELRRTATFHDPEAPRLVALFDEELRSLHGTLRELTATVQVTGPAPTEPVELATLTAEVLGSLQPDIEARGAVMAVDVDLVPVVPFARASLRSVVYNLLSNALKYAAPDRPPVVRFTARRVAGETVLTVQDNGLGLDLDACGPRLFGRFQRFHEHVSGTGLGLYLVQRIVQAAGGRLEVESTVGTGTTFRVVLPAAPESAPQTRPVDEAARA